MAEADRRAFICGHPVGHSRSPLIHGHWLAKIGIAGTYEAVDVAPAGFAEFLSGLGARGYCGGNVTIPHKEAALELVARTDEAARRIGAINTVWLDGARLIGTNTDWLGFAASMDESAPGWDGADKAVVLGAGGAARGIVHALAVRGIRRIRIVNRTAARAAELASAFRGATGLGWNRLAAELAGADLLVNTTSLGMAGKDSEAIDLSPLARDAIVTDIVYVPLETPLLRQARVRGLRCVDGLGMLLHQAVPGFEKWFGMRPEVTAELRELVVADLEKAR